MNTNLSQCMSSLAITATMIGYLLPVYSKASRKLKMHEIPVIQRRVSYVTSPVPIAGMYNSTVR